MSGAIAMPAGQEWRRHWPMVLTALIGFSVSTLPSVTMGVFMAPLQQAFGWSRTEISAGLAIFAIVSFPLAPLVGVLVDRFGPRLIGIVGLTLSALSMASFSLLTSSLYMYFGLWVALTITTLLVRGLVWTAAVSEAFTSGLGLALAITLCGSAVAQITSPYLMQQVIAAFGWRTAYVALGFGWTGVALVLTLLFFRNFQRSGGKASRAEAGTIVGGLTVKQALRSPPLIRIFIAVFAQTVMAVGVLVHLVPMLAERGVSAGEAAGIAALLGVGAIVGKLANGWLTDRTVHTLVPTFCYAGPALAYAIILTTSNIWALSFAVFLSGYFTGGSQQMTAYLTARYAGLRNYGTIYGIITTASTTAAGVGPVLAGRVFDLTGSYTALFSGGIFVTFLAGISAFRLGKYPDFSSRPDNAVRAA